MARQGSLGLLDDPVAQALLGSANPAKLAYSRMDGSPRVVPIWFHWTGEQIRPRIAGEGTETPGTGRKQTRR